MKQKKTQEELHTDFFNADMDATFDSEHVAAALGVSPSAMAKSRSKERYFTANMLHNLRWFYIGNKVRYRKSVVMEWLNQRETYE